MLTKMRVQTILIPDNGAKINDLGHYLKIQNNGSSNTVLIKS